MKAIGVVALLLALTACTDNLRARSFGGEMTVRLEPGQRLVNATWKAGDLWLLQVKDTTKSAGVYEFREESTFGVVEGKVVIVEQ